MKGQYQGMEKKCNEDDRWDMLLRRWKKTILLLNSIFGMFLRIPTYLAADTFPGSFSLDCSRNSETIWKATEYYHRVSVFYLALSCSTSSRNVYLHVLGMPWFPRTGGTHRLCYVQKWSHCPYWTFVTWNAGELLGSNAWLFQVQPNLWQWVPVFESYLKIQSQCLFLAYHLE